MLHVVALVDVDAEPPVALEAGGALALVAAEDVDAETADLGAVVLAGLALVEVLAGDAVSWYPSSQEHV